MTVFLISIEHLSILFIIWHLNSVSFSLSLFIRYSIGKIEKKIVELSSRSVFCMYVRVYLFNERYVVTVVCCVHAIIHLTMNWVQDKIEWFMSCVYISPSASQVCFELVNVVYLQCIPYIVANIFSCCPLLLILVRTLPACQHNLHIHSIKKHNEIVLTTHTNTKQTTIAETHWNHRHL